MAFQIKNAVSITASFINRMKVATSKITDFSIGSIPRTMLEAVATELDQLYQQVFNGLKDAIATAVFGTFNFTALPAIPAIGGITITIMASGTDTLIEAGAIFSYSGSQVSYSNPADFTISAGNTSGLVPVTASLAGPIGNLPAGVSFSVIPPITGFVSAINQNAIVSGRDAETDAQRKGRFNQYIDGIARSHVDGIEYGACTATLTDDAGIIVEQVRTANVVEPYLTDNTQPVGLFNVYIHNGAGSTSDALVSHAGDVLYGYIDDNGVKVPGYKAAGTKVVVLKAAESPIDVTGVVAAAPGYDEDVLASQAAMAISNYILGLSIGGTFVFSECVYMVRQITGVQDYVQSTPTSNQGSTGTHKLVPGTISITGA